MSSNHRPIRQTLTYDDVLIRPRYSEINPRDVDLSTFFSRRISMRIPIVSAAMDTVTEFKTAIVMAQEGGIGVIHKNMPPVEQAKEVAKVKKYEAGMVVDPISVGEKASLGEVKKIIDYYGISGILVVDENHRPVGILTGRDWRFENDYSLLVRDLMTKAPLVTAKKGVSLEDAKKILHEHRIEKLPVLDDEGKLVGLITIKDIQKSVKYPNSNKDSLGRLRVAAAVGIGEKELLRAEKLVEKHVDALVVDTAHGDSFGVVEMVRALKLRYPHVDIVAGNIATAEGAMHLIEAGVDAVKVGVGPGSICTTRVVAGIGVPQFSAVLECAEVCRMHGVPLIADGGIKYSGDIVKALGAGAGSIMVGSLFAGTDEAPGEMVFYQGRTYKVYRGMGSLASMNLGSKDRYAQAHVDDGKKLVPEGIEGEVPYRGNLSSVIFQLNGGVRSGMGYVGALTLQELRDKAEFVQMTSAGFKESHPHDVRIVKEAPNYNS